jgi:hypothetical protein
MIQTYCRSVDSTAVSSSADGGDSNINISKRFSKVEENGLEDNIIALNPFNLEPLDDAPPSGLLPSSLLLFIFYIINCLLATRYMICFY